MFIFCGPYLHPVTSEALLPLHVFVFQHLSLSAPLLLGSKFKMKCSHKRKIKKPHKWNKTPISLRTSADVLDMNWSFHPPWYAASGPFVLCGMQRSKQGHLMSSFPTIFWSCLFLVYLLNSLWVYFAFLLLETRSSSQAADIAEKVTALNWKLKHNLRCLNSHSHTGTELKLSNTHWPF